MSKRKRHALFYEWEQSGTKRLPAPDEMKVGPTSSRGSSLQPDDPPGVAGIKHGVVIVEELVNLSRKIYNWRSLAVRLGFEEENIAAINLDYQAISEKAFAMLSRWRQREGSAASYQVLYDALCHPFVNRRDLAEESCMRIDERSVLEIGPSSSRGSFSQIEERGVLGIKEGVLSNEELELLSVKIKKWQNLARRLQFLRVDVQRFHRDNESLSEKAFDMLIAWKRRKGSGATYRVLYDALCHKLVNRRDLAEEFCICVRPFLNIGPTSSSGSFLEPEDLPGVRRIKHGVVIDHELELLSVRLGEDWRALARRLGFTSCEIEAIDEDSKTRSENVFKMLMLWKQRVGSHATYQVLHDALRHYLVNRMDLVEKFCIDHGRPFLDQIPSEIIAQGPRGVLAFKNALKDGEVKVYRGRIMFVGQDRAGKTSLKNSFLGLPFVPTQQSTDGIDVDRSKWEYDVDQGKKNLKLTDERFGISQHLNDIARKAAKEIKEEATKTFSHDKRELDVPKETNHEGDEVPGDVEENSKTKQARRDGDNARAHPTNEIPELSFDPAAPPDEFRLLLEQYLKDVNLLSDANTEANHITLDLWDFAGQDLYYASYPAFLSPRAVYMLVCNLSKGLKQTAQPCVRQDDQDIKLKNPNQETNTENLLSWLASICSLRSSKQVLDETEAIREGLNHLHPPVFIVGTHADTPFEEVEEMLSQIRTEISETSLNCHVIDCCAVDNKMGPKDERLVALKERMIEVLNKEPYMGEKIPIRWLNFERIISALTERNVDYLSVEEVQVIATEKCFITEKKEFDLMLNFYHDLGIIVKHGTTVILNAKWLIELFRKLITIPKSNEMDPVTRNHWNKLQRTGILSMELVDRIFKQFFLKGVVKNDILSLMEHFGLIAKFSTSSCDAESCENYFVPAQMITGIESLPDIEPSRYDPCPLYIDFCTGFVPHGLFAQIVSRSIRWVSEMTVRRKTSPGCNPLRKRVKSEATPDIKLCQNGACFIIRRNIAHRLKLICEKRFIKIFLKKERKAQQSLEDSSNEIAAQVLEFLENTLQDLSEKFRYLHGLQYRRCVACPSCGVEDLVEIEDMSCTVSQDSVVVDGAEQWLTRTTVQECVSPLPVREQSVPDSQSTASSDGAKKRKGDLSTETKCRKTDSNPPEVDVAVLTNKELPKTSKRLDLEQLPIDILLLTVKDCEFLACLSLLTGLSRMFQKDLGDVYIGNIGEMKIAVMKCRMGAAGPGNAAGVVRDAVKALTPKAVFCVGYCGGLQPVKVKLGDVVISEVLITYAPSKVTKDGIEERGYRVPLKPNLAKVILNAAAGWRAPLRDPAELEVAQVRGALLSGAQEVDDSDLREALLNRFPGAIAIEMEGEGVYSAAHDLNVEWIIIKGVSDFADGKNSEKNAWRPFASIMAASVVAHILSNPIIFEDLPHYNNGKTSLPPSSDNIKEG